MQAKLKERLLEIACAPYRPTGRFNYHWARGKLGNDPIFEAVLDQQVLPDNARIIDLGCGRGLLAAWCLAAEKLARQGEWLDCAPPPTGLQFRGIEIMVREAECGNKALQPIFGNRVHLSGGDMRLAELQDAAVIAILDVLHYISFEEQDALLDRIRSSLAKGGVLLTRVGDANAGYRFRLSQWVDRLISFVQGHRMPRMWCRSLPEWIEALEKRGFVVTSAPMSKGTPFANVMLMCHVP